MPRPIRWPQLIPGVLIVAGLAIAIVAVLTFGRLGALHGDTTPLYVTVGSASGVMKGTEVWLDGRKIGLVDDIRFRSVTTDTAYRLLLAIDVYTSALPHLRRDSDASIRPGGTLIGAPVVDVSSGTSLAPPLAAGDTIRAVPVTDGQSIAAHIGDATHELPAIMTDTRRMLARIREERGSAGLRMHDDVGQLAAFVRTVKRATVHATRGTGTLGRLARDTALRAELARVSAGFDSVQLLLSDSARTSYGRFHRDSTLLHALADMRSDLGDVRGSLSTSRGTAGHALTDSALERELRHTRAAIDALVDDIKHHPLRYVRF